MPRSRLPDTEPLPGYRLMERLGRGGYGEVWKAEAPGGLFKAIKFVYGDMDASGDDNRAATQELKALNRVKSIRHPFILSIERFDVVNGQLLIVMELADRSLWDRYQQCREQGLPGIPRDELLRFLDEAAEALDLMNLEYQIQHLDIKPQNLFLVHNHIKVADFGLAKDLEGVRATITGGVTPVYAAPETFEGWVSRYCDQYSLAIVYQELLTGMRPFSGTNARQLLLQHLTQKPDLSSLSANERDVVARALSKVPDDRFASCTEFVRRVREAGSAPVVVETKTDEDKTLPNFKPAGAQTSGAESRTPTDGPAVTQPAGLRVERPGKATRLPALVTPGTAAAGQMPGLKAFSRNNAAPLTARKPPTFDASETIARAVAKPVERNGSGILFPVYVLGLGRTGLGVLQELRLQMHERFGTNTLPHWRWLYIDTDAESVQSAVGGDSQASLDAAETCLTRLHRPAHYLKQSGLPPPESWMSTQMLYRIPREPATTGLRCLGRLALCDHYQEISQHIREDLESFLTDDALMEADRQTGLGIRRNQPQVYVATSIAGGTGSGMVIDVAYIVRNAMMQLGFNKPQLTGLLLTPPFERNAPRNLASANAHATLTELNYFATPGNRFEARYDMRQEVVTASASPFERCVLFNLPRTLTVDRPQASERAAALIVHETLSPLGRSVEEARNRFQTLNPKASMPFQSCGMYRIRWPRQRLVELAAARLAQTTVRRWCLKDLGAARADVSSWLEEEWKRRQLDPLAMVSQFNAALVAALGDSLDAIIEAETQTQTADPAVLRDTMERVFKLVGKPGSEDGPGKARLQVVFEETGKRLARESALKFAKIAVHFIEQPGLRFAAAEEAIRLATTRLHLLIDQQDRKFRALVEETAEEFRKLGSLVGTILGSRKAQASTEIISRLRSWARLRLDLEVSRAIGSTYRQMLSNAPGYIREVNVCRQQLGEFAGTLQGIAETSSDLGAGVDHSILASGCKNMQEYADRVVDQISVEEFFHFEEELQMQIRRQFRALLKVCGSLAENGRSLRHLLLERARMLIDVRVGQHSSAEELFANRADAQSIQREMLRAYDACAPEPFGPVPKGDGQSFVLGVPADESGRRLAKMMRELMPQTKIDVVSTNDDVVLYREFHDLCEIPQAGLPGAEAAREVRSLENIELHARTDVPWPS